MYSAIGSLVRGPVAITVMLSLSIEVTSFSITVMFSWFLIFSVIYPEKMSLSTASAEPAGTRAKYAACIISEPIRSSSSFKRPTAFVTLSERKELEQTSSAKLLEW